MFGASEDPLHALVLERGHGAPSTTRISLCFVVDGREGLVPGDHEIAEGDPRRRQAGDSRDQQDGRSARAGGAWSSISSASIPSSRCPPSTAKASAICSMKIVQRLQPARGGDRVDDDETNRSPSEKDEVGRRDRRPSERGQVVAGEPVAARGADDRQRDARDDARCRRYAADVASPQVPHRRYGGHPAGRARRPRRAGRVGERAAGAPRRSKRPTSSC